MPPGAAAAGARTVVSAALCYYAPAAEPGPGEGRLPRYTWSDAYAELRERLDALGRRLGGAYRVLVDANQHVDREAAARSGRRLLRQEHAPDHAAPRLLGRARHARHATASSSRRRRSTPTAARARSASRRARPARSTSRARSTRRAASPTGRRRPARSRSRTGSSSERRSTAATSARTSVRGTAGSRSGARDEPLPAGAEPHVSLVDWLAADPASCGRSYERLYVPRNDGRQLQRNALVALGNSGGLEHRDAAAAYLDAPDPMLREHAAWALARLDERHGR